jgi:hypothetical protein
MEVFMKRKPTNRPSPQRPAAHELASDELAKIRGGIAVIIIAAVATPVPPAIFAFPDQF